MLVSGIKITGSSNPRTTGTSTLFVIGGLIGKKFPQLKEDAEKLAAKISRSRLQGGIHFTFDQEFGKQIAEDVLNLDLLSL
jgi:hypothetical protein